MRLPIRSFSLVISVSFIAFAPCEAHAAANSPRPNGTLDINQIVERFAAANGLPLDLVKAIITIESSWRRDAHNGSSVGLMQITPATAKALGYSGSSKALFDPETNIALGVCYLAQAYELADGDLCGTVARYQSGLNTTKANAANRAYCKKMKALLP